MTARSSSSVINPTPRSPRRIAPRGSPCPCPCPCPGELRGANAPRAPRNLRDQDADQSLPGHHQEGDLVDGMLEPWKPHRSAEAVGELHPATSGVKQEGCRLPRRAPARSA
jgi:hypothetical protein